MKTDEIINLLTADNTAAMHDGRRSMAALAAIALASLAAASAFAFLIGFRSGLLTPDVAEVVLRKLAFTVAIGAAGFILAKHFSNPERPRPAAGAMLLLPAALGTALILAEVAQTGLQGWQARALGTSIATCLSAIPLLAILPLAACLHWLKRGAPARPALAGAAAGIAAGGIGASIYAFYCMEDSALFFAGWYAAAIVIVAAMGAMAGRLWLRW